jgi:hypothetical protein
MTERESHFLCFYSRFSKLCSLTCAVFLIFLADFSWAQLSEQGKAVSMEWENVPGNSGYEVEVVLLEGDHSTSLGIFKVQKPEWTGTLAPGNYQLRILSFDSRHVPGQWGDFIPFSVKIPAPTPLKPENGIQIKTESHEKASVDFEWTPILGAVSYEVMIFQDQKKESFRVETSSTNSLSISLPVAAKYQWQVMAISKDKVTSGTPKLQNTFTLYGKKLPPPKIEKPESQYINVISWVKLKYADKYSYILSRRNEKGAWEILERKFNTTDNFAKINSQFKGGQYRIRISAGADLRPTSSVASLDFPVYIGDRSPEALELVKMRQAMENDKEKYFIATYLISSLSFIGDNKETGNRLAYNVLAGTGRLGYGYMPKSKWGFLSIVDFGGVNLNNKTYTFLSAEAEAIWRTYLSLKTQLRLYTGVFIKEIPEAKAFVASDLSVTNIMQAGPLAGMQVWTAFSSKFGLQTNAQVNMAMLKMKTPNGNDLVPSISYQLGMMGSLRLRENVTGFAGLAYRVDRAIYKATPYKGGTDPSLAVDGDVNTSTMTGLFLNLYLEWGF